ncbi:MAG: response regulator transcription factor [Balneolaceae bacterium]
MAEKTILVVDDEQDILDLIEYNLAKEGYAVLRAENGESGIRIANEKKPDLILLDIMMPKMGGLEVCRTLRSSDAMKRTPIIFLTARGDEKTEVEGLDIGADDFITKPISMRKLLSRIHAVMRRFGETIDTDEPALIEVHDLKIDRDRYLVFKSGVEHQHPRREFELLWYLAGRKGRVLNRETLLNEIWGNNVYVVDRTVDVHVRKIRERLGDHYIETVKGVGYRFKE